MPVSHLPFSYTSYILFLLKIFTSVPKVPSISFNVDFIWLLTFHAVTGPVARFARQIASQGYIVAAPSSYHEFTGPEALAYEGPGTDKGNEWKITKKVEAYDEDAKLSVDALLDLPTCNGRIGATGKSHETQLTLVRD
jgi:carboxymethylenebutenolidase